MALYFLYSYQLSIGHTALIPDEILTMRADRLAVATSADGPHRRNDLLHLAPQQQVALMSAPLSSFPQGMPPTSPLAGPTLPPTTLSSMQQTLDFLQVAVDITVLPAQLEPHALLDATHGHEAASIMASATPFCFCTTQKHLTVKIIRSSMT